MTSSAGPRFGPRRPGRAALPMYPLDELRSAHMRLWAAMQHRVSWLRAELEWGVPVEEIWRADDLVLGQTCGWPLVTSLADRVTVLGAFMPSAGLADGGARYRSVVVTRAGQSIDGPADLVAAVNGPDSLSGWISLGVAVHGAGGTWPGTVRWTGSHAASIDAVRRGAADITSIDAVTWTHLSRWRPHAVHGLQIVARGPVVPCLPLIAGPDVDGPGAAELRSALAGTVADPSLGDDLQTLLIAGFEPLDLADYLPLLELTAGA